MSGEQNQGGMVVQAPVSKAALTSMILGIAMCVPLAGLMAVGFAIKGFSATKNNLRQGRGMAIAGLILGIVSTLGWVLLGFGVMFLISLSEAPRRVTRDFARDVAAHNMPAAQAACDGAVTLVQLQALHRDMTAAGTYVDLTSRSISLDSGSAGTTCTLSGTMDFGTTTKYFEAKLIKNSGGAWKIVQFTIR